MSGSRRNAIKMLISFTWLMQIATEVKLNPGPLDNRGLTSVFLPLPAEEAGRFTPVDTGVIERSSSELLLPVGGHHNVVFFAFLNGGVGGCLAWPGLSNTGVSCEGDQRSVPDVVLTFPPLPSCPFGSVSASPPQ